jgi:hypothetical protein
VKVDVSKPLPYLKKVKKVKLERDRKVPNKKKPK